MVKWKVTVLIIAILIFSVIAPFGLDLLIFQGKVENTPPISANPIDFTVNDIYLADKSLEGKQQLSSFDVTKILNIDNGAIVTVKEGYESVASITDNLITVHQYAPLKLIIDLKGNYDEIDLITVEGVNIVITKNLFNLANIYGVIHDNVILHTDVRMKAILNDIYGLRSIDTEITTLRIKGSFYGNGYSVDGTDFITNWYDPILIFSGENSILRDTKFFAKKFEYGNDIILEDLYNKGETIAFGDNNMNYSKTDVENCIFENGNRNAMISYADVSFKNCLFQNAADSNVSIKSVEKGASNVSFKNCILANAVVSNISNWCTNKINESSQCSISFENTKFFGWKETSVAKIVPVYEKNANIYNAYLQQLFKRQENKKYLISYNGKEYFSTVILVICTAGGDTINNPQIIINDSGIKKMTLPIDNFLTNVLSTCDWYGYNDFSIVNPDDKVEDFYKDNLKT